ncbi:MAG TPA: TetR/AcrR family transcriptional regulator [Candidatus Koribacter sp.]
MVKSIKPHSALADVKKRSPGRPRSEEARAAILTSTLELLEKTGFGELTIEAVAAHAGVGKTTIYRWWPTKAVLVADAFMSSVVRETRFPDTGSIREDIRSQMQRLAGIFRGPRGRILRSLIGGGQSDPELIAAFRNRWLLPRRAEAIGVLERAIKRGQLPPSIDPNMLLDTLYGPLYFRMLIGHGPISVPFVSAVCDAVLAGFTFNGNGTHPARH